MWSIFFSCLVWNCFIYTLILSLVYASQCLLQSSYGRTLRHTHWYYKNFLVCYSFVAFVNLDFNVKCCCCLIQTQKLFPSGFYAAIRYDDESPFFQMLAILWTAFLLINGAAASTLLLLVMVVILLFICYSAAMLCFYAYVMISGGNPPPKKKLSAAVRSW